MDEIQELEEKLKTTNGKERIDLLLKLAEKLPLLSRYAEAAPYAEEALVLAEQEKYPVGIAKSLYIKGILNIFRGEINSAIDLSTQASQIELPKEYEVLYTRILVQLAIALNMKGEADQYKDYARKADDLAKQTDDHFSIAWLLIVNAIQVYFEGDFDKSIDELIKALKISEKHKLWEQNIRANQLLGVLFSFHGDYIPAFKYFRQSIESGKTKGHKLLLAPAYLNFGSFYQRATDYHNAEKYYNLALDIAQEFDGKTTLSAAAHALGSLKLIMGDPEKAIVLVKVALQAAEEIDFTEMINTSLTTLGHAFFETKEYSKSLDYSEKAFAAAEEHGYSTNLEAELIKAKCFLHTDNSEKAHDLLIEGLSQAQSQNLKNLINDYLETLAQSHEIQGNYKEALEVLKKFIDRQKALTNEEITSQVAFMQAEFDNDQAQKNAEIERLRNVDLVEARDKAEAANKAKSVFLANMSHELRTPLNAIMGFSRLIEHEQGSLPKQAENAKIIHRSGQHLLRLINDILDLAKIESGKAELEHASLNLHRLLRDSTELLRVRAESKDLYLTLEIAEDVPEYIDGDRRKVRQILTNLIGNAIKFTETGGVILRVDALEKDNLTFEVEDTGLGIAESELGKVFQPFEQTTTGVRSEVGSGLGLPISKEFVELMGGDITVKSEVGSGTVFRFTIPYQKTQTAGMVESNEPKQRVVRIAEGQSIPRILVVDDSEINRTLLREVLEQVGFVVRTAKNGAVAVELNDEWKPALIWMDMRMPVMDGYTATKEIKSAPNGHQPIIVALTASVYEEERARVLGAGCDDFMEKPFLDYEIYAIMEKYLNIGYEYENVSRTSSKPIKKISKATLDTYPEEWKNRLITTAKQGTYQETIDVIDEISEQNTELADLLKHYVSQFQFDKIVELFESDSNTKK